MDYLYYCIIDDNYHAYIIYILSTGCPTSHFWAMKAAEVPALQTPNNGASARSLPVEVDA